MFQNSIYEANSTMTAGLYSQVYRGINGITFHGRGYWVSNEALFQEYEKAVDCSDNPFFTGQDIVTVMEYFGHNRDYDLMSRLIWRGLDLRSDRDGTIGMRASEVGVDNFEYFM